MCVCCFFSLSPSLRPQTLLISEKKKKARGTKRRRKEGEKSRSFGSGPNVLLFVGFTFRRAYGCNFFSKCGKNEWHFVAGGVCRLCPWSGFFFCSAAFPISEAPDSGSRTSVPEPRKRFVVPGVQKDKPRHTNVAPSPSHPAFAGFVVWPWKEVVCKRKDTCVPKIPPPTVPTPLRKYFAFRHIPSFSYGWAND